MDNNQPPSPNLFHPLALAFLLSYLGAYFLLDRFNPLLGRYCLLRELFHTGMISIPFGSLVTGLNPSGAIHLLGDMFPSGWVTDTTNEIPGWVSHLKITGAAAAGELVRLPIECGLPKDDKSCNLKREFKSCCFDPANERSSGSDDTKGCLTLAEVYLLQFCTSHPPTPRNCGPATQILLSTSVVNNGIHHVLISPLLGHFEDESLAFAFDSQNELASASGSMIVQFPDSAQLTHPTHACVFVSSVLLRLSLATPSRDYSSRAARISRCVSVPRLRTRQPGAPFGWVHFTEYPPNPAYLEFTLEEILIYDPEARTRETETVYRESTKVTIPSLLFRDKYNYLPRYLVLMTPPLTLWPSFPQESVAGNKYVAAKESTSTQKFGVMYITLTGLIDLMVPAS
ncbi:hypothetical protein DSO57_1018819 [Entomophthora muscae]|uniref:Uncharacterized protein n=1 Tax=Entomophthora muscae TaxID=34485 RepID=A0ACC2ST26_9FUNG|nr:hypothetical protein DSO57_1018819 [Entomophthora muscae]